METTSKLLYRFFGKLFFIAGFMAIGCVANDTPEPMENSPVDSDLYLYAGMNGDEKIPLNLDPHRRLYRLENPGDSSVIMQEMKAQSPGLAIAVMPIGESSFLLVSRSNTSLHFPNSEKIQFQVPVYTTKRTGFTYFFDGRIMLKPKEGVSVEEILNLENELKFLKKLSSRIHFFSIDDGGKVLDTANQIYESGLVEACLPNYLAPIVRN